MRKWENIMRSAKRCRRGALLVLTLLALASAPWGAAQERDRHANYYYPPATVTETYEAQASTLASANRMRRLGFAALFMTRTISATYAPPYILFAKGANAEKLIIVGMGDYVTNIYQGRALLAQLTAQARTAPVFQELEGGDALTFLDLVKMLGFEQVTVTDGTSFTLQIAIR
jgi:hypothetical protein